MYRLTRHVYDASRRYYLFGRDLMLKMMAIRPGDRVLEMGCGTARNLIKLHRLHPQAYLYGLDASRSMLQTAEQSAARWGCADKITLRHCLAEQLEHARVFGLPERFDVIFFSYSLSMMPTWPAALEAAIANLKPDGVIYIVDFWDQAGLPRIFAGTLKRWLVLFGVHYRWELTEYLRGLEEKKRCRLTIEGIGGRYAYLATVKPV